MLTFLPILLHYTDHNLKPNSPCTSAQPPGHTPWCDFCAPGTDHTPDTPAPGPPRSKASAPLCVCCSVAPEQEPSLSPQHLAGRVQSHSPPDPDSSSPLCWRRCGWACSFVRGKPSGTEGKNLCPPVRGPGDRSSSPQCTPGRRCDRKAKTPAAWKDPSRWSRWDLCWFCACVLSFWSLFQLWAAAAASPSPLAQQTLLPLVSNLSCLALSPGLVSPSSADKLNWFSSLLSDSCSFLCLDCFPFVRTVQLDVYVLPLLQSVAALFGLQSSCWLWGNEVGGAEAATTSHILSR